MSARTTLVLPGPRSPEGEASGRKLLTNSSAQTDLICTPAEVGLQIGLEDSARFAEELRRRYEAPCPLPQGHGTSER
jgi:hypothetical protein